MKKITKYLSHGLVYEIKMKVVSVLATCQPANRYQYFKGKRCLRNELYPLKIDTV
jgi:hypothetical protein